MEGPIASLVAVSLHSFQEFSHLVRTADQDLLISPAALADQIGRFRVWVSNIGAHRRGKSSLDFRLRDASHMRKNVTDLLEDCNMLLGEGK